MVDIGTDVCYSIVNNSEEQQEGVHRMKRAQSGSNIKDVKQTNRMLILKLIATDMANTRADIAKVTGLSKMAVGNLVTELIGQNFLEEDSANPENTTASGRPPVILKLAAHSPKICGILIKRGLCQLVISDLSGKPLALETKHYESGKMSAAYLTGLLRSMYESIAAEYPDELFAIGIASIGPVNSITGEILNPPDFYGLSNLNITQAVQDFSGLPVVLINDANAGALAEKLYGRCRQTSNFIYLHIMNGIGAGLVLEDKLYNGNCGQSGEIGHTSISFSGPRCSCGNIGCLDLYANQKNMLRRVGELRITYPDSPLLNLQTPEWEDFVALADQRDPMAMAILDEFCGYLSFALSNALNLLDVSTVVVGYNSHTQSNFIERVLSSRIANTVLYASYREIPIVHSFFGGNAPLIGAIAAVADQVFSLKLPL